MKQKANWTRNESLQDKQNKLKGDSVSNAWIFYGIYEVLSILEDFPKQKNVQLYIGT